MEWSNPTTAIDLIKIIEIDHDKPGKELIEAAERTTTLFPAKVEWLPVPWLSVAVL